MYYDWNSTYRLPDIDLKLNENYSERDLKNYKIKMDENSEKLVQKNG